MSNLESLEVPMYDEVAEIVQSLTYSPGINPMETNITVNTGPEKGVVFKFGRVWFPDPDKPIMSFDYDIVSEQKPNDLTAFRQFMGVVLQNQLLRSLEDSTTVYSGGVNVEEGHVNPETVFSPPPIESKILTPWSYKLPQPEPGTKMSRNLMDLL